MIVRRILVGTLLVLVALCVAKSQSFAQLRAGRTPFTESATTLRASAKAAKADPQADAVVLLDEVHFTVRNRMVTKVVNHRILKVQTEKGVSNWAHFGSGWAPWYQDRPVLKARVLDTEGKMHKLDASTIEQVATPQGKDHTYSDWRELRAPLAAVHPGSVIETVTIVVSTRPYAKAGDAEQWFLGNYVPTLATRIVIDSDRKLSPRFLLAPKITKTSSRKGKTYRYVFENGRLEGYNYENNQPYDVARVPMMMFSTGGSWKTMASEYAGVVESQMAKGALPTSAVPRKGKNRHETISKALAALHKRVRYTGLEFGKNATVPWTPAESWKRQFGDCKDKATMLVAMLRAVGIKSHVALLRSGLGQDVNPGIPGMGGFNHAIVYVPAAGKGSRAYWIDATSELATLGQVGSSVQGRLALVAAKGTKKLIKIPVSGTKNNRIVEERKIVLPGYGKGSVEEVTYFYGTRELDARYSYRDRSTEKLRTDMEAYVADHYKSPKLSQVSSSDAKDMKKPLRLSLKAQDAGVTYAGTHEAGVYINRYGLFELVPSELMAIANEKQHLRSRIVERKMPLRVFPSHKEWKYRIEHPPGFEAKTLPRDQDRMVGVLRFRQSFRVKKGFVEATFSVLLDRTRLTAEEVNTTRAKVMELLDGPALQIRLHHDAMSLWERGKVREAVAILRDAKSKKQSPRDLAEEHGRMVQVLLNLGLNRDAQRIGKQAQTLSSNSPLVAELLAYSLEHSAFGIYLKEGSSREQALLAYERAEAINPDSESLRGAHAKLLLRDSKGRRFQGDLKGAIPRLKVAMKAGKQGYDWLYVHAMYRAENYEELLSETLETEGVDAFAIARLATTFQTAGTKAMLKAAEARDISPEVLGHAINLLADGRDYQAAIVLSTLAKDEGESELWYGLLRQLERHEVPKRSTSPKAVIVKALGDLVLTGSISHAHLAAESKEARWQLLESFVGGAKAQLPPMLRDNSEVLIDLLASQVRVTRKETSGPWHRVELRMGAKGRKAIVYLAKRGRTYQLLTDGWSRGPLVSATIASLDRGRVAEAQAVMEWAQPVGDTDDDWGLFSRTQVARRVAHSLMSVPASKRLRWHAATLSIWQTHENTGKDLRTCADAGHAHCAEALATYWAVQGKFDKALVALSALKPQVKTKEERAGLAIAQLEYTLRSGKYAKAESMAAGLAGRGDALHKRQQGEVHSLWSQALSGQARFTAAQRVLQQAEDAGYEASANNLAWQQLFLSGHPAIDDAIDHARAAGTSSGSLHTLAALLAAKGEYLEAMEVIVRAQEVRGRALAIDWLVYGRVAAGLGFRASAHAAYERVFRDKEARDERSLVSTARLAKLWDSELAR